MGQRKEERERGRHGNKLNWKSATASNTYIYIYIYIYICVCVCVYIYICIYVYIYIYIGFKTFFYVVRHLDSIASYLPIGLHLGFFRSWPSLYLPSSFFFGLPRALFCFGIHFNAILGNLSSAILWTWTHHITWFYSIYFIIVSSSPICVWSNTLTQIFPAYDKDNIYIQIGKHYGILHFILVRNKKL
jgi:hypothetical protein